jgi:hypothetical protein
MQITIELPEDIAAGLQSKWKDLPRAALESLALEADLYRQEKVVPKMIGSHYVLVVKPKIEPVRARAAPAVLRTAIFPKIAPRAGEREGPAKPLKTNL